MSIEGGGDSKKSQIDRGFTSSGIHEIYSRHIESLLGKETEDLIPVLTYEEYLRKSGRYSEQEADYILERSIKESVAALDKLVREFNQNLDNIRRTGNTSAVQMFIEKAEHAIGQ